MPSPSIKDSATPLHEAAHKDRVEVVKALIAMGANKYAKDKVRWVPFKGGDIIGEYQPG